MSADSEKDPIAAAEAIIRSLSGFDFEIDWSKDAASDREREIRAAMLRIIEHKTRPRGYLSWYVALEDLTDSGFKQGQDLEDEINRATGINKAERAERNGTAPKQVLREALDDIGMRPETIANTSKAPAMPVREHECAPSITALDVAESIADTNDKLGDLIKLEQAHLRGLKALRNAVRAVRFHPSVLSDETSPELAELRRGYRFIDRHYGDPDLGTDEGLQKVGEFGSSAAWALGLAVGEVVRYSDDHGENFAWAAATARTPGGNLETVGDTWTCEKCRPIYHQLAKIEIAAKQRASAYGDEAM